MNKSMVSAGAARTDVTPLGQSVPMNGFGPTKDLGLNDPPDHRWYVGRDGPATGVHDHVFARALALRRGGATVVLVAADVLAVDDEFVTSLRERTEDLGGVSLSVAATHTHSAPALLGDTRLEDGSELREWTLDRFEQVIRDAVGDLRAARLGWARGALEETSVNRRDHRRATDPDVWTLRVDDLGGRPIAAVINYACHPTTLGAASREITADFPGYACRVAECALGDRAVALFCNGAAGDINPTVFPYSRHRNIDELERQARRAGREPLFRLSHRAAQRMGALVAAESLRSSELIELDSSPALASVARTVDVPMKGNDELEHYFRHVSMDEAERAKLRGRTVLPIELQALQVGDVRVALIPGEPFADIGLRIKEAFPGRRTAVIGYANGDPGYIPYREYYAENRYESVATPFSAEGVALIEEEAIQTVAMLG